MTLHHIQIAFRNFRRHPFFSGINVVGLAIGLAACWLISLYVLHERSYDQFLPDAERIYAVALDLKMQEDEGFTTNTPPPIAARLAADFPEIELAARTFQLSESNVRREMPGQAPLIFNETGVYAADTAFLEIFDFPMAEGTVQGALDKPGSLVLSERASARYFGKNTPIGQPLYINDRMFTVTGVVKDLPQNSTVQFDFLTSIANYRVVENFAWSWIWLQVDTWVRLRQHLDAGQLAALEAKFPAMVKRYAPAAFERVGQNFDEQMQRGDRYNIRLLPLKSLHLNQPELVTRLTTIGDGTQVRMFGIVGALVLLLACVNFMNLSTARSSLRSREVGVRKALGSQRGALIGQFLSESLLFSVVGMGLAAVVSAAALRGYNLLTEMEFTLADLFSAQNMGLAAGITLLTGLIGGLYPAFFLSKFKSAEILKGAANTSAKAGHGGLRSSLVVMQFSISIALMLGAWMVLRQLDFARSSSPGLVRENVLILPVMRNLMNYDDEDLKLETFRQQIAQLPEVVSASKSVFLPSMGSFGDFYEPEQGDETKAVPTNMPLSSFMADSKIVSTLGLEIIEGRNFMDDTGRADSCSVILNEAAVTAIGWEKPIGKWLRYPGNENQRFQVVGVMRDFHFESVRSPILPAAIFHQSSNTYTVWSKYIVARLKPGMEQAVLSKLSPMWTSLMPNAPFRYDFLDTSFSRFYQSDARLGTVFSLFTGLALFIACLGLFALAAFTAERRTKEIGIRKVLGASVGNVTGLLAKDFLKLVLISIVIASPVAWYFMQQWLDNFAYRVEIQWWMFATAGAIAVLIAVLTVGGQAVKAALVNPVKSLKSE